MFCEKMKKIKIQRHTTNLKKKESESFEDSTTREVEKQHDNLRAVRERGMKKEK